MTTNKLIGSWHSFLIGAISLYIVLWFLCPQGFKASDPWRYSQRAYEVLQGDYFQNPANDVRAHRLAVFVPVAFFYRLFGVNVLTTHAWPLCAALMILVTVSAALPTTRSKIFSIVLCVMSVPLFKASVVLMPDVIAAAFMALSSLFLFYRGRTMDDRLRYRLFPVIAVVCLFIAFLAKLSAYWVLPLWLITLVSDIREKNKIILKRFYVPAVAFGVVLGVAYLLFSESAWGNPIARFASIQALTGRHSWAWEQSSFHDWVWRLTLGPARLFVKEYGVVAIFAFLALWVIPKSLRFWAYYTILTVSFFWFGTTSFSRYEPLPIIARMTLPSLPGFYILGGYFASCLTLSATRSKKMGNIAVSLLIVALVSPPGLRYFNSRRMQSLAETHAADLIRDQVEKSTQRQFLLVCSDSRSPKSLEFYFGYEYPRNLVAVWAGELDREQLMASDAVFVFVHEKRSKFLESAYGTPHYDQHLIKLNLQVLYAQDGVWLYQSARPSQLIGSLLKPAEQ